MGRWTTQQDVGSFRISTTGRGSHLATERLIRRRVTENDRVSSARAARQSSGRRGNRAMKLAGVVVGLAADGRAALGADVVVLAAGGEDQQELLARRRRSPAPRAEEAVASNSSKLSRGGVIAGILHRAL